MGNSRRGPLPLVVAVVAGLSLGAPGLALGFGTTGDIKGQDPVHWKIARAALECAAQPRNDLADDPGRCIEPETMSLLSGHGAPGLKVARTEFGAVEAPDIDAFFESDPHCTDGDYLLPSTGYNPKQTFARRTRNLRACRRYLLQRFESAIDAANGLVDAQGRIVSRAVSTAGSSNDARCRFVDQALGIQRIDAFNRRRGLAGASVSPVVNTIVNVFLHLLGSGGNPRGESAKCQTLLHLGATLHAVQDAYAHGNWTDRRDPGAVSIESPPALGRGTLNPFIRMVDGTNTPDPRWITACYSLLGECERRVDHADFAKDNGEVALRSLPVDKSRLLIGGADEPRGRVRDNFRRAVEGARRASKDVWKDLGRELLRRYPDPPALPAAGRSSARWPTTTPRRTASWWRTSSGPRGCTSRPTRCSTRMPERS